MNPRKHPVWAAVFGASYMRLETLQRADRTKAAVEDADDAVENLLAHDKATRDAEEAAVTGEAVTFEQKGKDTVEDILTMFWLYPNDRIDYRSNYRSNSGILLDIVERFDPEVARRLRDGEDPRSLSEHCEEDEA